jgi:hypothetical protein
MGCTREFAAIEKEHRQAAAIRQNVFRIVIRARHQHKTLIQIRWVPHAHVVHIGNAAAKAVGRNRENYWVRPPHNGCVFLTRSTLAHRGRRLRIVHELRARRVANEYNGAQVRVLRTVRKVVE